METRDIIEQNVRYVLLESVSSDYVDRILNSEYANKKIIDYIIDDVLETSGYSEDGGWSYDDIKLAVGRVLLNVL